MKRIFSVILFGLVAVSMMAGHLVYYVSPTAVTVTHPSDKDYYRVEIAQKARNIGESGVYKSTTVLYLVPSKDRLEGVYSSANTGTNNRISKESGTRSHVQYNNGSTTDYRYLTGQESTITIAKADQNTYYIVEGSIYVNNSSNTYDYHFCYDENQLTKPVEEIGKKPFLFNSNITSNSTSEFNMYSISNMSVSSNEVTFNCKGLDASSVSRNYTVHLEFPSSDINGEYSTISQDPSRRLQNTSYVEWDGTKRYLTYDYVSTLTVVQDGEGYITIVDGAIQGVRGTEVSPRRYHFAEAIVVDENKNGNDVLLRNCIRLDKTLDKVQLTRSLSKEYYNTFCSPIRLTAGQINAAFGEGTDIRALENTSYDEEKNEITLNFSASSLNTIEAGMPYFIRPAHDVENPVFTNVAISAIATEAQKVETEAVSFHGILSPYTLEADDDKFLFLAANNTLKFGRIGTLKGMRAYFYIKDNVPAQKLSSARARIQMGQDVTTSVLNTTDCSNAKKVLRDGQIVILRDGKAYNVMGTVCE